MRTLLLRSLPCLVVPFLLTACENGPTAAEKGAFLQATLKSQSTSVGATVDIEHRGGANWGSGTKSETQRKLQVYSLDREANRSLKLQRLSSAPEGPFQPGVYTLVPRNFNAGDNDGYTVYYGDSVTGNHYISESGTWTITEVSADGVVTGHFDFVAAYWCNPHNDRDRCFMSPKETGFRPDAVRLRVRGEFRAEKRGPAQDF